MMSFLDGGSGRSTSAATAIVALGFSGSPALASGPQAICRTYRPVEAMAKDLGSKSALAYFMSEDEACSVVLTISEKFDPEGAATPSSGARVPLALPPGGSGSMDSEEGGSLMIQCGHDATTMHVPRPCFA